MGVFIDTGIFVGAFFEKDQYHKEAKDLFERAYARGEFGMVFTSDYVLDEFVSRMISHGRLKDRGIEKDFLEKIRKGEDAIQNSKVEMLQVSDEVLTNAKIYFREHYYLGLTLTDWTTALLMKDNQIEHLLSFDSSFGRLNELDEFGFLRLVGD